MKVSEAKALCPQFEPMRKDDGRVICKSLMETRRGERLCRQPDQCVCLLPAPPRQEQPALPRKTAVGAASVAAPTARVAAPAAAAAILPTPAPPAPPAPVAAPTAPPTAAPDPRYNRAEHGQLWSVSRLSIWQACPRKYFLRYLAQAPETNPIKALILGSAFHRVRERIDSHSVDHPLELDGTLLTAAELEVLTADDELKLLAVLEAYQAQRPFQALRSEVHFELGNLQGYIDAIDADGRLLEFKYAQSAEPYTLLTQGRQLAAYLLGFPEAPGIDLIVVKKPQCRRGKKESDAEFLAKARAWVAENGLLEVKRFNRSDFNLEREQQELGRIIWQCEDAVGQMLGARCFPGHRNAFGCPDCSYFSWCASTAACSPSCWGECPKESTLWPENVQACCQAVSACWRGR